MTTTADKLNRLLEIKANIKQAIRDKGVYIGDYDAFAEYPDAIRSIETGSGEGGEEITGSYIIAKFPDDIENGNDYIKKATELDVSHLDISRMRTMNDMFNRYENLTALDLSSWDVSNIEEMTGTFDSSGNITTFGDISNWNTSNLRGTRSMFGSCRGLITLDLSNWNVSNITDMYNMFAACENLEVLDLRNWDVSNLEQMERSFYNCTALHTIRLDNCNHDTIEKVVTSSEFPTGAIEDVTRKIYVNPDNVNGLTAPTNWIFVDSDGNEISEEQEPEDVCEYCGEPGCDGSCRYCPECGNLLEECTCESEEPEIYQVGYYKENTEITEATTMVNSTHTDLSWMFYGCTNLTTINNIEQWDTSNVTDMSLMFDSCNNLTSIDVSSFDMSNVENTSSMFGSCRNLTSLDLSNFNTSNVTSMDGMFSNCRNLTSLDLSNFNTSNVTSINGMFEYCTSLTSLDIRNFDMSNVRSTNQMFQNCNKLQELRLDNCDHDTIEKIINGKGFPTGEVDGETRKMYVNPDNIEGLTAPEGWIFVDSDGNEISGGEIPVCEYCGEEGCDGSCRYCPECGNLLEECTCEPEIYQVGYYRDKSDITEATTMVNNTHTDLSYMFSGCTNLTTINGIEQWDTSNVTNMSYMFYNCSSLVSLDLRSWDISNVTELSSMFEGCSCLTELNLIGWTSGNVEGLLMDVAFPDSLGGGGKIYINFSPNYISSLTRNDIEMKGWGFVQV